MPWGRMSVRSSHALHMDAPADGKTTEELVPQALALSDGRETTGLDLLGVQLEGVLGELEALLHEGSKLADAATLLAKDLLGVGGTDDDLHEFASISHATTLDRKFDAPQCGHG